MSVFILPAADSVGGSTWDEGSDCEEIITEDCWDADDSQAPKGGFGPDIHFAKKTPKNVWKAVPGASQSRGQKGPKRARNPQNFEK